MKRYIILSVILSMAFVTISSAQGQNDTLRTSTLNHARMAELTIRRGQLKQQIVSEDKKRNSQIASVAPEQMELINLRQDSLCLELRSQLFEVELEIQELTASMQETGSTATPVSQGTVSVQQALQSLRRTRPARKEEDAQKIE